LSPSAAAKVDVELWDGLSVFMGLEGGWVTKPVAARVADARIFLIQGPWLGLSVGGGW